MKDKKVRKILRKIYEALGEEKDIRTDPGLGIESIDDVIYIIEEARGAVVSGLLELGPPKAEDDPPSVGETVPSTDRSDYIYPGQNPPEVWSRDRCIAELCTALYQLERADGVTISMVECLAADRAPATLHRGSIVTAAKTARKAASILEELERVHLSAT